MAATSTPEAKRTRSAGILLHPTSLPGPYGIGDLGRAAYAWVDALVRAGQTWWQVLPLGHTGYGDSPYQSFSAFAGNPYLISPDALIKDGLLKQEDLADARFPADRVEYGRVIDFKKRTLARAWENFQSGSGAALRPGFEVFCARHAGWLDDYALFLALKDVHGGVSWQNWPAELIRRDREALARARQELAGPIGLHQFCQLLFHRQWDELKAYANSRGLHLIGDMPIFVASDSVDVWSNPHLFLLNSQRKPLVVAGVPPDYFSETGQLWGNPLYDWEAMRRTSYQWWVERIHATLRHVDLMRLDHFRGFAAYWQIPAGEPTAINGKWVQGPGAELFDALRLALGRLPIIAEDLGEITPDVEALRVRFGLPGMRILQFAFGGATEPRFLPHNFERNTVVYTGTHDNDTTRGWYAAITEAERHNLRRYTGRDGSDVAWDLIRLAWTSVADYAVAPLQDLLDLGTEARMNLPGHPSGNWGWRFTTEMLNDQVLDRLADLTDVCGRRPD